MSIISFPFFCFLAVGVALYYLTPGKFQWGTLLVLSLVFYAFSGIPQTFAYLLISAAAAYGAGWVMMYQRAHKPDCKALSTAALWIAIGINLVLWFFFKAKGLWAGPAAALLDHVYIDKLNTAVYGQWIPALGMGYYTLQVIGYMVDCYWENAVPQKNPLKLLLFTAYFPQLTTGPISQYNQLNSLYEGHRFSYRNAAFGCQRILWGLLKKLILAECVGTVVSGLMELEYLDGIKAWLVILMYPIQMYADFSGCMDIILGASELFGIQLPENFRNPFFSRTVQEFWLRWHITLGAWVKSYVLYPLLKTGGMVRFGKACKKRFGKQKGKLLANTVAMTVPWLVMGIWHGGWQHILGVSLWHWSMLMLGEWMAKPAQRLTQALHIKTDSFSWHLFQSCRTYLIFAVGAVFFHAGVGRGLYVLGQALRMFWDQTLFSPWTLFDGSLTDFGMTTSALNLMIVMLGLIAIVGVLREKYGYARVWMERQCVFFRWMVWVSLFLLLLIWGSYGPGYSAAQFIYQGF